jgi:hypothetical protein
MALEIETTYDGGVLKPEQCLPLADDVRVRLTVYTPGGRARASAGLLRWQGDPKDLDNLLGPDNHPWAADG